MCNGSNSAIDENERKELQKEYRKFQGKVKKELKKEREEVAKKAKEIWRNASEIYTDETQLYTTKKEIDPIGGVKFGKNPSGYESLIIPIKNIEGKIRSLQFISCSEVKTYKGFLTGGEKSGNFFQIGEIVNGNPFYVVEGYATGVSVHLATEKPVIIAFDSGNLKSVIGNLRIKYPKNEIIIAADNDQNNIGQEKAREADGIYTCKVVLPSFPKGKELDEKGEMYTDFNDLHQICGIEEVKRQINSKTTPSIQEELKESDISIEEEDIKRDREGEEIVINGIPKMIASMEFLDRRFAQLEAPGQPCVLINRIDAQPISESDFKRRLSGEVVCAGVDENNNPKYISASKFWQGNSRKCIYKKIVFTNSKIDNSTYNLFSGFGIEPKKGKCEKILNHIKKVVCSGSEVNYDAFLKLLAWQIQNIGKPSRIITVLKSKEQQIGKGCLLADILGVIYGNSGFTTSEIGQIITRFNDTIRGKAYIFLDEALFSGDRKAADAVKSLATCTRMGVEAKGIPTVQFPIAVNLFLATNHDDAAYVEETDARYWILEVSPHRSKDTKYFDGLYEEIENGGREAFMDHLLTLDVSEFVPSKDVPKDNAAKEEMIRNSINPYDARKWLEECFETGMLLGYRKYKSSGIPYEKSDLPWEVWKPKEEYVNGIFFTAYTEWQKSVKSPVAPRPTGIKKFGELLNAIGFDLRIDGQRRRTMPSIEKCQESLKILGKKC